MTKENNLGKGLVQVISGEYIDPVKEVMEAGIDALMEEGSAAKELPLVSILYSTYRAGIAVRDALFIKKLSNFLEKLSETSQEEREQFVRTLHEENKEERFGESILLLIDRADDLGKPKIIGTIMQYHILGKIEYDKALRLCHIVDKSYLEDLRYLPSFSSEIEFKKNIIADNLHRSGLLNLTTLNLGSYDSDDSGGNSYIKNDYGNLLEEIVLVSGAVDSMFDQVS